MAHYARNELQVLVEVGDVGIRHSGSADCIMLAHCLTGPYQPIRGEENVSINCGEQGSARCPDASPPGMAPPAVPFQSYKANAGGPPSDSADNFRSVVKRTVVDDDDLVISELVKPHDRLQ